MEWHPYAKLFPMMDEESVQALADDIRENGQKYAVIVNADDLVVDGRNRLVACQIAGVEPLIEARDMDDAEVLRFVASVNIHRRHLTASQRADIASRMANGTHGGRRVRNRESSDQEAHVPLEPVVTQAEAAQLMDVSERSVRSAAKVQKRGAPELQQAVASGDVTVHEAARIADLPPDEQPSAVAEAKAPKTRKRAKLAPYDKPRLDESEADALCHRIDQWIALRFDRCGGAELRDTCSRALNSLKQGIAQWQQQKPMER